MIRISSRGQKAAKCWQRTLRVNTCTRVGWGKAESSRVIRVRRRAFLLRNRSEPRYRVNHARQHRPHWHPRSRHRRNRGRKGVALPLERWARLKMWNVEIEKAVNEATSQKDINFKLHIGQNIFICVTTGILCIDMRQWYMNKQSAIRPGRTGIALQIPEWVRLRELIPEMMARSYKLRTADICFHDNQEGQWICTECCPNGISQSKTSVGDYFPYSSGTTFP